MDGHENDLSRSEVKGANGFVKVLTTIPRSTSPGGKTALHQKLDRQREKARKSILNANMNPAVDYQPKKTHLLPITKLPVPAKHTNGIQYTAEEGKPLVSIDHSDSEDDLFEIPLPIVKNKNTKSLKTKTNKELTEQLRKDGFKLDELPDDEDLDLIPPKPYRQRWACCGTENRCSIQ